MTARPGQAREPRWIYKAPPPPCLRDRAPMPPPIAFRAGMTAWGLFRSQQRT